MKQEEKDLLLRDLCARLPYGVYVTYRINKDEIERATIFNGNYARDIMEGHSMWIDFKPYLRPMNSMTIEEKCQFKKIIGYWECGPFEKNYDNIITHYELNYKGINELCTWLYKNHFDFNGLIPIGLALPAKEGMYNTKQ